MKHIVILLTFLVFITSCSTTHTYQTHKVSMVDGTDFNYPFIITNVHSAKNHNGFLEVQVEGLNKNKHYTTLEYRVEWLDARGFKIHSMQDNRWFAFPVFRNQTFTFNPIAYTLDAIDFKVFIRDPKHNTYNAYNSQQGEI